MSFQSINIGSHPADGAGDPLRVSFNKINQNFIEVYTAVTALGGNVTLGNNAASGVTSVNGHTGRVHLSIADLAGGVTKGYVDNQIAQEINGFLNTSAPMTNALLSAVSQFQSDPSSTIFDTKANTADVYTKAEVDTLLLNMNKTPPTSAIGQQGDVQGMTAMDSTYIYSCNAIYDGITSIWARTPLNTTW
jgi:hypothetical protein